MTDRQTEATAATVATRLAEAAEQVHLWQSETRPNPRLYDALLVRSSTRCVRGLGCHRLHQNPVYWPGKDRR